MRIFAKSADAVGYKEPLADHTLHDLQTGHRLIVNLPFSYKKKRRLAHDLTEAIAFHDVGKAANGFQTSLDGKPWGHRHEILSAAFATALGASDAVVFAVLTHHKTLPGDVATIHGCLPEPQIPYTNHIEPIWQEMTRQWYANIEPFAYEWRLICEGIGRPDLCIETKKDKDNLLSPLSDSIEHWLRRDTQTDIFRYKQREYVSLLRGLIMSADHIASALGSPSPSPNPNLSHTVSNIPKFSDYNVSPSQPYGFQIQTSKHKGNLILRAPTGSGKTEGSAIMGPAKPAA